MTNTRSLRSAVPRKADLLEMLRAFAGRRVLVWADLCVDRYLWGAPKRVSREAPVLILDVRKEWWVPGGGANAIMNLRAMGGMPVPFGAVGADEDGGRLFLEDRAAQRSSVGVADRARPFQARHPGRILL